LPRASLVDDLQWPASLAAKQVANFTVEPAGPEAGFLLRNSGASG
jgi:hypothetical protein